MVLDDQWVSEKSHPYLFIYSTVGNNKQHIKQDKTRLVELPRQKLTLCKKKKKTNGSES